MWINAESQPEWVKEFDIEQYPEIIVFKQGKRNKFMKKTGLIEGANEGDIEKNISGLLNQIIGGNGRFKRMQSNTIPELTNVE